MAEYTLRFHEVHDRVFDIGPDDELATPEETLNMLLVLYDKFQPVDDSLVEISIEVSPNHLPSQTIH